MSVLEQTRPAPAASAAPRVSHDSFRTDIEGLRAVGVLLVVAFHASIPGLAGGFVGVDVFFVISGFLITGLLTAEGTRTGRISLQDFYARRVRRILPAACVVAAVTALALPLAMDPLRQYRAVLDLGAAVLYVSNWRFINQGNDYLAVSNDHSPALHYWSLSVEEQFYLVWPLLIVAAFAVATRAGWRPRVVAFAVLSVVTAGSLAACIIITAVDANTAYMATYTRAWQFGVGGLLALVVFGQQRSRSHSRTNSRATDVVMSLVGIGGLAAIAWAALSYGHSTVYPGVAALLPTLGTAAMILGGSSRGPRVLPVGRLLSLRPLRWVGRMSYSWYLWHWPVIVLVQARWPGVPLAGRVTAMLFALLLAWMTHLLVERPLITYRAFRRSRVASVAVAAAVTLLAGLALTSTGTTAHAALASAPRLSVASYDNVFGEQTKFGGPTSPSVLHASADTPQPNSCLIFHTSTFPVGCTFGPRGGTDVFLFGDSHAQQWQSALQKLADEHRWRLHVYTQGGCPSADVLPSPQASGVPDKPYCYEWRARVFTEMLRTQPRLVFIASSSQIIVNRDPQGAWDRTLRKIAAAGARPVLIRDTATPPSDIPTCVAGHQAHWSKCLFSWETKQRQVDEQLARRHRKLASVDVTDRVLCHGAKCPAVANGLLLYRDDSHLTDTAVKVLTPELERQLSRQGLLGKVAERNVHGQ